MFGQFLDCPDIFWIVRTVFGLSRYLLDCPDSFWIIWIKFERSGQFLHHEDSFQPVLGYIWTERGNIYVIAKTFWIFANADTLTRFYMICLPIIKSIYACLSEDSYDLSEKNGGDDGEHDEELSLK